MIYFAQLPTGGIKIGYSEDVERRMEQLAYHYGDELSVLHTMPGDRAKEREMHERFAHLRLGRTEQFQPGPDLMAFIGRPLLVTADPNAVEPAVGRPYRAIAFRVYQDYDKWIQEFADRERASVATLIDQALAAYARERGHTEPPKRV